MSAIHRVNYGLNRIKIQDKVSIFAVPFKGKDFPDPKSEFAHADIAIGFTLLSYL